MYIPFLARQKTNAWQLAVLPCVFGILFWYAARPAFEASSYAGQLASATLLGGAVALLGFVPTGGLRACGMGLCLSLAYIAIFGHGRQLAALTMGLGVCMLVGLARLVLPKKLLTADARVNFRSFFWIAGLGAALMALAFLLGASK